MKYIRAEFLKLKNSPMLVVSFLGAMIIPLLMALITYESMQRGNNPNDFQGYSSGTTFFFQLIIGIMLIGLLGTYSYHREFQDKTLKSYLTIPVSRFAMFFSKQIVLLFWTLFIMLILFLFNFFTALPVGITDIRLHTVLQSLWLFVSAGILTFFGCLPIILLTLIFKNYMVSIGASIVITLINTFVFRSKYITVFPWTSPIILVNPGDWGGQALPAYLGWISFGIMVTLSLIAITIYLGKMEVNE